MRLDGNIILPIVFGIALIPKMSKQEKPEDCIPGKQFWSTFFNSKGTCATCPRYVENCKEQGPDEAECKKSCGGKSANIIIPYRIRFVLFHNSYNKI